MNTQIESPSEDEQPHARKDTAYIVADIGGTNARLAVYTPGEPGPIRHQDLQRFKCSQFKNLAEVIDTYLEQTGREVDGACVSIAGPTDRDCIEMTNRDWSFSISDYKQALGFKTLLVINDGAAAALATTRVEPSQLENIKPGTVEANGSRLNLIPGTGFGLGCIIPHNDGWLPVLSEGGHATLAAVTQEEYDVLQVITGEFGRAVGDNVLSGPGMFNIYKALAIVRGHRPLDVDAKEMTRLALEREDEICSDALDLYFTLFGRLAGDLALTLNAHGGIYLSGSLMQRIGAENIRQSFNNGFTDKDIMTAKVERVPVNLLHLKDQCLLGASVWLNMHLP